MHGFIKTTKLLHNPDFSLLHGLIVVALAVQKVTVPPSYFRQRGGVGLSTAQHSTGGSTGSRVYGTGDSMVCGRGGSAVQCEQRRWPRKWWMTLNQSVLSISSASRTEHCQP